MPIEFLGRLWLMYEAFRKLHAEAEQKGAYGVASKYSVTMGWLVWVATS